MKPIETTKQGQFGYGRTSVIRRAEIDPESSRGVFGSIEAASKCPSTK